jgi:hypothetical protein
MVDRREPASVEFRLTNAKPSTPTLKRLVCLTVLAASALAGVALGGCAANTSRNWAQMAPVIAPVDDVATVSLGASQS